MWEGSSERGVGVAALRALLRDRAPGLSSGADSDTGAGKEAPVSNWAGVGLEIE